MSRPELLTGETHKVKIALPKGGDVTFYVTVNFDPTDNLKPYEVFVNVKNAEYWEHLTANTVLISRLLQSGVSVETIAGDLKAIHSTTTSHFVKGGWTPSVYARIGDILLQYVKEAKP